MFHTSYHAAQHGFEIPRYTGKRISLRKCPDHGNRLTAKGTSDVAAGCPPGAHGAVVISHFIHHKGKVDANGLSIGKGTGSAGLQGAPSSLMPAASAADAAISCASRTKSLKVDSIRICRGVNRSAYSVIP